MQPSKLFSLASAALIALSFLPMGCKDNASNPVAENLASEDAANVIAGEIGTQSGGVNDMLTDLTDLRRSPIFASPEDGGSGGFGFHDQGFGRYGTYTRTYDPQTQTWTVVIEASFQNPRHSGSWRREYKYFFSKNNVKQQFFITNGVMADKVNFEIVESGCSGQFTNPRISHQLTALRGSVEATVSVSGNDTLLTVNSVQPRYRAAIDSIRIRGGLRTSNHNLTLTLNNVVVPTSLERRLPEEVFAGRRFRNVRPISGTITGTYNAFITFQRGDRYDEREVTRNFTITFGNGGGDSVDLEVTGRNAPRFKARINLQTGELN
ncbi:MAG: hypothetical protein NZM06_07790 [Chloroherpetonaceae bacterium]|nr:hypothetical protein [Chloroherpetonaceae bacterium]MDW8438770.1 hypothetical protein [Chloroherpetonaceae bacterium]